MKPEKKENIGLALGGGAVLGAAHIGVIRAMEEFNVPIKFISGTSIGSLVASLYAFGIKWEKMQEIALKLKWLDISRLALSKYGLLSNEKIKNIVNERLGEAKIEDSKIPLSVIATDISQGKTVVINKGSVGEAVMASTCIPGVFIPVEKGEQLLIDGGIMENIPVLALHKMGSHFKIGVDLNGNNTFSKPNNIVEVLINTIHLTLRNASKIQTKKADLLITPDLSEFNHYKTNQVPELIHKGYTESKKIIEKYF
jgi:NTE family protein